MKAAVLGATGFLGRHICAALTASGAAVVPVSRGGAVPVDLADDAGARRLAALLSAERPGVVVNAAGRAWLADERQMTEGNARLVGRLVEAVATLPGRPRLIQLGSVHEYGPGASGTGTAEEWPEAPVTPYGRSKLLGTRSVLRATAAGALDGVVLRAANVSGPGTPPGSLLRTVADHLAGAAVDHAAGRPPEPLRFGPLRARRDFVDVRDVAGAVLAAARAPAAAVSGQIVNIGRGEAVRVRWLVDRMVELSGLPVPVVEEDGGARSGVEWQRLDISKARRLLGWRPRHSLDDSLRDLLGAGRLSPMRKKAGT